MRGGNDSPEALDAIYADLCAKNPAARRVVIDGVGHVPMLDAPREFNDVVEGFLAELAHADEASRT
ncbi:MAG: alpha/beta hydrolase [Actinomycetota bacterium]|nr:alpha/beta hydrolase [Actinomycetota bacterium]